MKIKHGTFTLLVFSVSGGRVKECSMFYKHVAERLAIKTGERYEKIISTIRCKLSFLILNLALICVRGSRSHNLENIDEFELVSRLPEIEQNKNKYVSSCVSFHLYVGSRFTPSFLCIVTPLKIKNCSINPKDFMYICIYWKKNSHLISKRYVRPFDKQT